MPCLKPRELGAERFHVLALHEVSTCEQEARGRADVDLRIAGQSGKRLVQLSREALELLSLLQPHPHVVGAGLRRRCGCLFAEDP